MPRYFVITSKSRMVEGFATRYIAQDTSSGGYPYELDAPFRAFVTQDAEKLLEYMRICCKESPGGVFTYQGATWEIAEIRWMLNPVKIKIVQKAVTELELPKA